MAAAALLAVVVVLALHPWKKTEIADPIAAMGLLAVADTADALDRRGRYVEALPYVDYLERVGEPTAAFESRAATAANNATIQVREKHGLVIPATRSAIERVALIRQSLRRAERAEAMAGTSGLRSALTAARAGQIAVWGFMREGYEQYRRAESITPLTGKARSQARWIETMLANPTLPAPAPLPAADTTMDSAGAPAQ
jgi:hypothetical protein